MPGQPGGGGGASERQRTLRKGGLDLQRILLQMEDKRAVLFCTFEVKAPRIVCRGLLEIGGHTNASKTE